MLAEAGGGGGQVGVAMFCGWAGRMKWDGGVRNRRNRGCLESDQITSLFKRFEAQVLELFNRVFKRSLQNNHGANSQLRICTLNALF